MVTVMQAAKKCGISRQTIYNYIHSGLVPVDQHAYDVYGIIRIDLEEAIKVSQDRAEEREKFRAKRKPGRKKSKQEGEIISRLAETA